VYVAVIRLATKMHSVMVADKRHYKITCFGGGNDQSFHVFLAHARMRTPLDTQIFDGPHGAHGGASPGQLH
jgi:hypothetical protein